MYVNFVHIQAHHGGKKAIRSANLHPSPFPFLPNPPRRVQIESKRLSLKFLNLTKRKYPNESEN